MIRLTPEETAAMLLNRLHADLGVTPQLEQVDFVECETGDMMAYCYDVSEACHPIIFARPPFFEPHEVETLMLRGLAQVILH
jgi:hypothetical protein